MARCGACPSALHQGWQHPLGANLGPYAGQGHLPLPLCTTVLWGELGPPHTPQSPLGVSCPCLLCWEWSQEGNLSQVPCSWERDL